jgi:hypothetical protein
MYNDEIWGDVDKRVKEYCQIYTGVHHGSTIVIKHAVLFANIPVTSLLHSLVSGIYITVNILKWFFQ